MPRMSDTMTEGLIVAWHKKVGDKIKPGDILAEVETDKATMELESYNEGTILYIGVEEGKPAQVEGVLLIVGEEGESYEELLAGEGNNKTEESTDSEKEAVAKPENQEAAAEEPKEEKPKEAAKAPVAKAQLPEGAKEIRMPLLSDTMQEGKIVSWNKKVGDKVASDDVLAEVETDKATMEVVGYEEGTLLYIGVEAGQAAKVNQIIAIVGPEGTDVSAFVEGENSGDTEAEQPAKTETAKEQKPAANAEKKEAAAAEESDDAETEVATIDGERIKASPLAKRLAAEKGFDITKIKGTGDGGRIVKADVDSFKPAAQTKKAEEKVAGQPAKQAETKEAAPKPEAAKATASAPAGEEGHTDVPLTQMRKVIARRLGESKFSAPHFYLTMELNMDNAMAARTQLNEISPVKISFNDMMIKAAAMALRKHPDVNASFMGDFIRQNHHIHIGSALALPEGLIVPVIKFADQKSLSQIAEDAKSLYQKAKDKKIQPAEFSGNTFTISNLGMMDIDEFTAIINPPDSCILAVGRIKEVVVKKGDGFGITNIMKVTLSCDHRSVDGAVGAAFLQTLKAFVENPVTMLV